MIRIISTYVLLLLGVIVCTECFGDTRILLDRMAGGVEKHAAEELSRDIRKAYPGEEVAIQLGFDTALTGVEHAIYLTLATTERPAALHLEVPTRLEPETFVIKRTDAHSPLLIAGADERGLLYGVYEFSRRVLGIDPLEWWTGKTPPPRSNFALPLLDFRESPPVFSLRGYFDNDNDHLANWRGRKLIVEFDTWKEVIDSLARLRYNYVDIHDLLGRPEYYLRDYYTQMTDYETDLELVDQVIDYIHSKGMLVQIPMMLGWQFRYIDLDQDCLSQHHDLWMEVYEYYLAETPIGKADLFVARPRHPVYDWAYHCEEEEAQGIAKGPLLERMFADLGQLIEQYQPNGQLVTDLWMEGRPLWEQGDFSPSKRIQVLWADDGYARFEPWPDDFKGYPMGIYLHAGVWHNQVVQDPYPVRIEQALRDAADRGMTHNVLVNGQNFKAFILNLEASARAAWDPHGFDGEAFYQEWAGRYFGDEAAHLVVQSLKLLHQAHGVDYGYRDITKSSRKLLRDMSQKPTRRIDPEEVSRALSLALEGKESAEKAARNVPESARDLLDDQVVFPLSIYVQNLQVLESIIAMNNAQIAGPDAFQQAKAQAESRVKLLLDSLNAGSSWDKWSEWYAPENFRIHTPPIRSEELKAE